MGQPFRSPSELATPTSSNLIPSWPSVRKQRGQVVEWGWVPTSWGQRGWGTGDEDSKPRVDESEEGGQEHNMAAGLDVVEVGPRGACERAGLFELKWVE